MRQRENCVAVQRSICTFASSFLIVAMITLPGFAEDDFFPKEKEESVQPAFDESVTENGENSLLDKGPAGVSSFLDIEERIIEKVEEPEPPPLEPITRPVLSDPLTFLRGLQDQYETDLFTGSATFSFPVWVPPGRNGMEPELRLAYSSSNTSFSSYLGYGWTLPVGAIYRSTPRGVDKLYSQNEFSAEIYGSYYQLISVDSSSGEYAARIEQEFNRFTLTGSSWEMVDTRGTVYTFGGSSATRQSDPSDSSRVYKWLLERIEDTNGNFVTLSYFHDNGQVYPDTIRYTGHGVNLGLYELRFQRTTSANPGISYRTGFKVKTDYVISHIEVYSYHTGNPTLIRTYTIDYEENQHASNLLKSITISGGSLTLPAIDFSYYSGTASHGLLQAITYPTGGLQTLSYKASTAYRTLSQNLANPNLPFIVNTVHTSTLHDPVQGEEYTIRYEYEGGHYYFDSMDAYTREYAGFHEVEITQPTGDVHRLYFHQSEVSGDNSASVLMGEFDDHISKKGRIYREEVSDESSNLLRLTVHKWDEESLPNDDSNWDRYFPKLVKETVISYGSSSGHRATAKEFAYGQYGNIVQEVDYGEVSLLGDDGNFVDVGNDLLTKDIEYALNATDYMVALPKKEQLRDQGGALAAESKVYYDGSNTLGTVVQGNVTKTEVLVEAPATFSTTKLEYTPSGLPIKVTNPRSFDTTSTYDAYDLYPATITNARAQSSTYIYDYRFGTVKQTVDPNGAITSTISDGIGRVAEGRITDPGNPTQEVTSVSYTYDTTTIPHSVTETVSTDNAGIQIVNRTYLDGFGRIIQTRMEAEGTDQYTVTGVGYDSRGNVKKEFLPVLSTGLGFEPIDTSALGTEYTYDALNRVTAVTTPVGSTSTVYSIPPKNLRRPREFSRHVDIFIHKRCYRLWESPRHES